MIEALTVPLPTHSPQLQALQQLKQARVLELGAGIGVVGISLAAAGNSVLQTDLPTLTEHAVQVNQAQNQNTNTAAIFPPFLESFHPISIGEGWVGSSVLDWTKPFDDQLPGLGSIDFIVACDCLWLTQMVAPVCRIVQRIFQQSPGATFLMTYQERGKNEMYCSLQDVHQAVKDRHWELDCMAWRPVEGGDVLFLFAITQTH